MNLKSNLVVMMASFTLGGVTACQQKNPQQNAADLRADKIAYETSLKIASAEKTGDKAKILAEARKNCDCLVTTEIYRGNQYVHVEKDTLGYKSFGFFKIQ